MNAIYTLLKNILLNLHLEDLIAYSFVVLDKIVNLHYNLLIPYISSLGV